MTSLTNLGSSTSSTAKSTLTPWSKPLFYKTTLIMLVLADSVELSSIDRNSKILSLSECCVNSSIISKKELNIKICFKSNSFKTSILTVWKISHPLSAKSAIKSSFTNFNLSKWKKNLLKSAILYPPMLKTTPNHNIKHIKILPILVNTNSGD